MKNQSYAGFWIRLGATIIDVIIICLVILIPISFLFGINIAASSSAVGYLIDIALIVLTIWFWLRYLGTPGKMILKLKIVDAKTGKKLSVGQAVGRYFAYIISMLPLFLGFFWIAFDDKKQAWHDKLAGSVVIRG